ncbi:aldehyde dehydrogenase family protein [Micromonospora globbae]|uniref:aldehyde dehydrogenase family protein n=1 Tax=Micromonospora globbae TaxID=1894969 RepID=UPI003430405C
MSQLSVLAAGLPSGPLRLVHRYGGRPVDGVPALQTVNPARIHEVVSEVPMMDAVELESAASTLRARGAGWARTSVVARGDCLLAAARLLQANLETIAVLVTREMGKTLGEARAETAVAVRVLEYYGSLGRQPVGHHLPDLRAGVRVVTERQPLGAVALITPWNDPVLTPVRKIAPALLCGNAVLFKPAESTAAVAGALVEILTEAVVPAEVVDLVFASGDATGRFLANTNHLDAVSFTGSTAAGRRVVASVAGRGVRVQAELGGKNAVVVHGDADLDRAVKLIMTAAFGQTGQRCSATSRLLVHESVHDKLVADLAGRAGRLRVGDGLRPDTDLGPVANPAQFDRVVSALSQAPAARCVTGGHRLTDGEYAEGLFVAPTIVDDVTLDSPLWTDEVFGPVLSVRTFADLDQAIGLVNASGYGLTSSIFTNSLHAAHRFVREVQVGNVSVNLGTMGWDVHLPFGGVKASGLGQKEQGQAALDFYSTVKTVAWGF